MTKEFWLEFEKKLSGCYGYAYLKCGTDKLTFEVANSKMKLVIQVYINGVIRGGETEENQAKYWNKKTESVYPKSFIQSQSKLMKKCYYKKELTEKLERLNKKIVYYLPGFSSFSSLKSQYKSRNLELRFMTQEEINQERADDDKSL